MIGRSTGTSSHKFQDDLPKRKKSVSRGLANLTLRDEDNRWLGVLTRRTLENLD